MLLLLAAPVSGPLYWCSYPHHTTPQVKANKKTGSGLGRSLKVKTAVCRGACVQ